MPGGFNFRDSYGRYRKPNLKPYRSSGGRAVVARGKGGGRFSFYVEPGVKMVGGWLAGAVIEMLSEEFAADLRANAPMSNVPHGSGTDRPWPHMRNSIRVRLRAGGRQVYGDPLKGDDLQAYSEVFIGFPVGLIEYGTRKMSARPFVFPAYDRSEARVSEVMKAAVGAM